MIVSGEWTSEGVVKEASAFSIPRRRAYVSCLGYEGIL